MSIIQAKLDALKIDRGRLLTKLSKLRSALDALNDRIRAYETVLADMGEELVATPTVTTTPAEDAEVEGPGESDAALTDTAENGGAAQKLTVAEAVRRAVGLMKSEFEVGDITTTIRSEFPEALEGVDLASIGAALSRLARQGHISVVRQGQGRSPSKYERRRENDGQRQSA